MSIFVFARQNARALTFGALHSFYSSPGQTYVIGLFVAAMASSLGISATQIGGLYLAATLASAATLVPVGHWIDHIRLVHFSAAVVVGLAIACFVTSLASSAAVLLLAFYLLRLTGQGLMMHVEGTATARTFDKDRGRALSITALGVPLAEISIPPLAILGIATIGWQSTYLIMGLVALFVVLPVTQWLLRTFKRAPPGMTKPEGEGKKLIQGLSELVRSRYTMLILPSLWIFPFHMTAVMFHIGAIAESKAWSPATVAMAFPVLATSSVIGLMGSGHVIDRFSARLAYPFAYIPLLVGLAILALFDGTWVLPVAFGVIGLGGGMIRTTFSAMWPEMFGVSSLGAIRSAATMFMVFASGLSPFAFGVAIDAGLSVSTTLWMMIAYGVVALLPAFLSVRVESAVAGPTR